MEEISEACYALEKENFKAEFEKLAQLRQKAEEAMANAKDGKKEKGSINRIDYIIKAFENHCRQNSIISFNGSRYDLSLVKKVLYPEMIKKAQAARMGGQTENGDGRWPSAIMKGNTTMALTSPSLKFLDLTLFLAPGFSLAKFLQAFTDGQLAKTHFCYEWLRDPERLRQTELPPKGAFYSTIKGEGISDEAYEECQKIFDSLPEKTMLQFLLKYKAQDVGPMTLATQKMQKMYLEEFGVDCFKQTVSIP